MTNVLKRITKGKIDVFFLKDSDLFWEECDGFLCDEFSEQRDEYFKKSGKLLKN